MRNICKRIHQKDHSIPLFTIHDGIITTNCKTGPAEILRVSYEDDVLRRPYPNCSIYPVGDIDSLVNAIDSLDDMCVDTEQLKSLVSHLDLKDVIDTLS